MLYVISWVALGLAIACTFASLLLRNNAYDRAAWGFLGLCLVPVWVDQWGWLRGVLATAGVAFVIAAVLYVRREWRRSKSLPNRSEEYAAKIRTAMERGIVDVNLPEDDVIPAYISPGEMLERNPDRL